MVNFSIKTFIFYILLATISFLLFACNSTPTETPRAVLVLHGGAGTITRKNLTPEMEKEYRTTLESALSKGYGILSRGGSSVDAVEKVVSFMEDSPLFNAGKGAVFASNGKNELDASIMDGKTLNAGAVSGITHIKNPIQLARLVMDSSRHILFYGNGAEEFAAMHNVPFVNEDYFFTERRWNSFKNAQKSSKHGTVGVLALDLQGNLAAATSTGGLTNKRFGRIGDSPIIGAGTYANNNTCAVSATGTGEYFIRTNAAATVSALMEFGDRSLQVALNTVIHEKISDLGGTGGLIGLDSKGNVAFAFNTEGMYRGYIKEAGSPVVNIYKDE